MYRQIPFSRLLLPLVVGIILAIKVPLPFNQFQLSIVLAILLVSILFTIIIKANWSFRWVFGSLVTIFLLVAGIFLTAEFKKESEIEDGEEGRYIIRLVEPIEDRTTSLRALAQVTANHSNGVWKPLREKVMVYFSSSDSLAKTLNYGSLLAIQSKFTSPPGPINPNQFDYRKYLSRQQIHRVAFISSGSWMQVGSQSNRIVNLSYSVRDKMLALFQRMGIDGENLAVLSALTMGYKSLLDDETQRVFSASGAMHILAVSGLHVGILFTTLSAFLFFLSRIKRGKYIKAFILICFLWIYAFFTGLSPSVIRASLMFSLVIIGNAYNRNTNIYNTLSSSAFLILAINPMLITNVGFQLSYVAVLSIVFFYPHFYKSLYIKNRWIDSVWSLICVSFAAQLGTFALGLYYFNQFPNYFLLTNLYAIPLAFIVLYLAIALIVLSPIAYVSDLLGWLLDGSLSLLNYLIRLTESLPYSTSTGISISVSQTIFLILGIISISVFIENRKSRYLFGLLIFLLVFFIEHAYNTISRFDTKEIVVFGQRQASIIGFKKGDSLLLNISDTVSSDKLKEHLFAYDGYIKVMGVNPIVIDMPFDDRLNSKSDYGLETFENKLGQWFYFNQKLVFIPTGKNIDNFSSFSPLSVDILLYNTSSNKKIEKILELVNPNVVVIDATVPIWQYESIYEKLNMKGINAHYIPTQGAYVLR